ncbi:MAG TPA: PHP domain-containing protein [Ktedonobacteraceae bacterium]|nr:PHP domain-containing protein [Ktedonobacteraceae bacterium]
MSIVSDFHNHVVRSSVERMARGALDRHLRILGLSEHIFQMSEARPLLPYMPQEGPFLTLPGYFQAIAEIREQTRFDVRAGLEVDFVPARNGELWQVIAGQPWDFLIGSVHEIDGLLFEQPQKRSREEGEALWTRYFELLRAAVACGKFSLVSHPVRMRSTNPFLPANLDDELEHLAAEATRHDIALEINGYDILTYPSLVRRLARACALHATPISVGSDAHIPNDIARGHQLSLDILREAGINNVRIWKAMIPEAYPFS